MPEELAHSLITAPDATPEKWVLVLHGILGSRSNWRTLARKVVRGRPSWGACLVDLRMHGDSQGMTPPHTIATAAADLGRLSETLPGPVRGVLGHSFGGKVALEYTRQRAEVLSSVVLVDSMPGPRPAGRGSEDTVAVVAMLRELGASWASREAFIEAVVAEGKSEGLARWLAMNLSGAGEGYVLRLDLDAIDALLESYFAVDLWPVVEAPPAGCRMKLIVGGASDVFADADLARATEVSASTSNVTLDVIEGAGHWVHVDAPAALLEAWGASLDG